MTPLYLMMLCLLIVALTMHIAICGEYLEELMNVRNLLTERFDVENDWDSVYRLTPKSTFILSERTPISYKALEFGDIQIPENEIFDSAQVRVKLAVNFSSTSRQSAPNDDDGLYLSNKSYSSSLSHINARAAGTFKLQFLFPPQTREPLKVEVRDLLHTDISSTLGVHSLPLPYEDSSVTLLDGTTHVYTVPIDVSTAVDRWLDPHRRFNTQTILFKLPNGVIMDRAAALYIRTARDFSDTTTNSEEEDTNDTFAPPKRRRVRRQAPTPSKIAQRNRRERRTRRRFHSHRYRRRFRKCKRHKMYVHFTTVGWANWIIAPVGYDAYMCYGKCSLPFGRRQNVTNHALLQEAVRGNKRSSLIPKPCCAPTEYLSYNMLVVNKDEVNLQTFPNMVVNGCGCQ